MEDFILKILAPYGLQGIVIACLGWAVYQQYRSATKVNESRLGERDVLIKALENNTQATKENASAILARNQVTEELSKAIEKQAAVLELFMTKSDLHSEALKDKMQEFKLVIDASAEAQRVNTGIIREVRDRVGNGNGNSRSGSGQ